MVGEGLIAEIEEINLQNVETGKRATKSLLLFEPSKSFSKI
jgi:hypothetical protein